MINTTKTFLTKSKIKAEDLDHRRKINFNISKYNATVVKGKQQFLNIDVARQQAKNIKWNAIEHLDTYLEQFEKNIIQKGGKVIWAENADQALTSILDICNQHQCKIIVKSKSMVTEEIHLNDFLQQHNIESVETDLGEYIQQLDNEPPYHIVTPAMHKSKEDVAKLFAQKLCTAPNLTPTELTQVARKVLRKKYIQAQIGITGANFLVADIGGICITENEGNARLSAAFPNVHIVIAGIEKIIPSVNDLNLFWPLLSTYGTGQNITVYNSIITGPRQNNETDGPKELYVILLDNGRANLLTNTAARESLYCIRCGSCLNACPVYKNIGGHAYGTTYSGPIGSVITPHLRSIKEYKHLSYASSLCGNCTEVCPVRINIHELLLENRKEAVQENANTITEKMAWRIWRMASLNRKFMNIGTGKMKTWMMNTLIKGWSTHRNNLTFPSKTFNQLWREKR